MPELPEVHTTVLGIKTVAKGLTIINVWTDYGGSIHAGKAHIKDKEFFTRFKKAVLGQTITDTSRRGKNVLIHLSNSLTILIHMKMTGHVLFGKYKMEAGVWIADQPGALQDPFNGFIHLVFTLPNGKHLVLSDVRKFAKVTFFGKDNPHATELELIGPEPLEDSFTWTILKERLATKSKTKIKTVLMDQSVLAGIGNIYSDEILFEAGIHPESIACKLTDVDIKQMTIAMKSILTKSITMGGDSLSDYRNIYGERGGFQDHHKAYRQTGKPCPKKNCSGTIARKIIGGRSSHFCLVHQILKV
jgi:formamidopyrimidine-DNA glycosylase